MATEVNGVDLDLLNPKYLRNRSAKFHRLRFGSLPNPIPAQIRDQGEIEKFFSSINRKLIPYAGTRQYTSHALLHFLIDLCYNSKTQAACIESQSKSFFGGRIAARRKKNIIYNTGSESEPISPAEAERFFDFVQEHIKWNGLNGNITDQRKFAKSNFFDYKSNGNVYTELAAVETLGIKKMNVHAHDPTHCLHAHVKKGAQKYIFISPIWTESYVRKNRPKVLPVWPKRVKRSNGVQRCIIQTKCGNFPWYGRPDSIGSLLSQFNQFQNDDYRVKQTAGKFMGEVFVEFEDDDPKVYKQPKPGEPDKMELLVDEFSKNHTNEAGQVQSAVISRRGFGSKQAFVFQFQPYTNESWFKVNGEELVTSILSSHHWSRILLAQPQTTGLSDQGNLFFADFEIRNATVGTEYRNVIGGLHDRIIQETIDFTGFKEFEGISINFESAYDEMINQRREQRGMDNQAGINNNNQNNGNNQVNNSLGGGNV